jgi:MFS family permease
MRHPVFVIIFAQLFGTSLWFSANSATDDLQRAWGLVSSDIGWLTNAVQLGFIVGTLTLSMSGLADRFRASRIFALSAVLGALFNAAFALLAEGLASGMALRFAVGCCLAGVYPLGMKLVVSWAPERAGPALAWLVGMLTLGTALPHGVRWLGAGWAWQSVILTSSAMALLAASMVFATGDGPHLQLKKHTQKIRWGEVLESFRIREFRASALGYFGHQWELFALWTLVPALLVMCGLGASGKSEASALAFAVIGVGAAGCIVGGWWSRRMGSARVAAWALASSALCCALFPFITHWPAWAQMSVLLFWGATAVADSPHFSALSAKNCDPRKVGSALSMQNAIGFGITMVSIQIGTAWVSSWGPWIALLLLPGPLLGLLGLYPLWKQNQSST